MALGFERPVANIYLIRDMGERLMTRRPATLHEITAILGDLEAAKAEAILATGATVAEIEEAQAWAAGESDVMGGDLARPLSGPVAAVFEILSTEEPLDDRD
jgi:hypothetical protein